MNVPRDFSELLRLFNTHRVEYLVVGGYAVAYYGYPRATGDIDIWIAVSSENAERTVVALREFGFDVPGLTPELFSKKEQMVRMGLPPLRVEIMTSISGVEFASCYASRVVAAFNQVEVNLIDLGHLKENKKVAGRFKDLNDLENLP